VSSAGGILSENGKEHLIVDWLGPFAFMELSGENLSIWPLAVIIVALA
jgi:hypothetical protein